MTRYVVRRIIMVVPILFCVIFIVYSLMSFTPGNPAVIMLGDNATPEAIEQLNHELGYDQPFPIRFFNYMKGITANFDFGKSYLTKNPVFEDVAPRIPVSLKVAFNGILCASLIGIPLGILSAVKQYSAIDNVSRIISMFFSAIPPFWLGMMLMYIFALKIGLLPSMGIKDWKGYILPMFTLGIPYAAMQLRMTRSAMLETLNQDYIRTAKAKGASAMGVIIRHVLKNALLPIITITATQFGGLLGGAIITETLFSLPGIGTLLVTSIRQKDTPIVLACTIILAIMFCLIMLSVDILYAFIDPRIKEKYSSNK